MQAELKVSLCSARSPDRRREGLGQRPSPNKWEPFQNNTEADSTMQKIDYRQQLLEEIEGLSDRELEKIYRIATLLRHEFLEEDDEARYYTDSWIQAEPSSGLEIPG
jgi:hypothetical protein